MFLKKVSRLEVDLNFCLFDFLSKCLCIFSSSLSLIVFAVYIDSFSGFISFPRFLSFCPGMLLGKEGV